jgi:hypothetical protein
MMTVAQDAQDAHCLRMGILGPATAAGRRLDRLPTGSPGVKSGSRRRWCRRSPEVPRSLASRTAGGRGALLVAILRTCRRAMAPGSKLLIVERLLAGGNEPALDVVMADVTMLIQVGGRERTDTEYRALLEAADLRLAAIVPTTTPFSVLEAVPA